MWVESRLHCLAGHYCFTRKLPSIYVNTVPTANYYKGLANQERPGVKEGTRIRRLTPLECERLQGFPDNWTEGESDTQRYKMCGNAVTVNVVQAVMEQLKPCFNRDIEGK